MSYLDFLRGWYNLVFLLAGAGGLACFAWGRIAGRDLFRPAVALRLENSSCRRFHVTQAAFQSFIGVRPTFHPFDL